MSKTKGSFQSKSVTGTRNKTIKFRVTEHTEQFIKTFAKAEGKNISDLIHLALQKYAMTYSYRIREIDYDFTNIHKVIDMTYPHKKSDLFKEK